MKETVLPLEGLKVNLLTLLNPYINGAFFADLVILVEGEADRSMLLAASTYDFNELGADIIPVDGKNNLDKLICILEEFKIPYYVIFDNDSDEEKSDTIKHSNIALQKLLGITTIHDFPEQQINNNYAIFEPNMLKAIKSEYGEENWSKNLNNLKESSGIKMKNIELEKKPKIISMLIGTLEEQGFHSKSLEKLCGAIRTKIDERVISPLQIFH